jgi:hypothetical protein
MISWLRIGVAVGRSMIRTFKSNMSIRQSVATADFQCVMRHPSFDHFHELFWESACFLHPQKKICASELCVISILHLGSTSVGKYSVHGLVTDLIIGWYIFCNLNC